MREKKIPQVQQEVKVKKGGSKNQKQKLKQKQNLKDKNLFS